MKPRTWPRIFTLTLACFLLAALLALRLHQKSRAMRSLHERHRRLLLTLTPDLQRLDRYEAIELALRDALQVGAAVPALPAALPAPVRRDMKRLPAMGEWSGVRLELAWPQLETRTALDLISFYATNPPAWRIERLQLDTLDPPGASRLQLTLERVEANLE
jgi:hypothetical protein